MIPNNIERSGLRKGEYSGYGNGFNWRVRRNAPYKGDATWLATSAVGAVYGRTLAVISERIRDPKNSCS